MAKKRVGRPPKAPQNGDEKSLLKHSFEKLAPASTKGPPGYVFVPKGDVYVTRHCREMTGASGNVLYVIYDPRNNSRLGLRCPAEVFDAVTARSNATAQTRKDAVLVKDKRDLAQARTELGILFPRLPLKEVEAILAHGFEKSSGRVGRTGTLTLKEKVELATVAHARHMFTDYEERLGKMRRQMIDRAEAKETARREIRERMDEILASWKAPKIRWNVKPVKMTTDAMTPKASTWARKKPSKFANVKALSSNSFTPEIKVAQKARRESKLQTRKAGKNTKPQVRKPTKRANVSKLKKTTKTTKTMKTERRTSGRQAALTAKDRMRRTSQ